VISGIDDNKNTQRGFSEICSPRTSHLCKFAATACRGAALFGKDREHFAVNSVKVTEACPGAELRKSAEERPYLNDGYCPGGSQINTEIADGVREILHRSVSPVPAGRAGDSPRKQWSALVNVK
jgi:hypothetical protein